MDSPVAARTAPEGVEDEANGGILLGYWKPSSSFQSRKPDLVVERINEVADPQHALSD
jgi:hypothetical protein